MLFFLSLVFLAGGLSHIRPQMTQLCSKSCRNLQTTTSVFCPLFFKGERFGKATLPFWIRAMPSQKLKRVKKMCSHKLTDHFQLSPVSFPHPVATECVLSGQLQSRSTDTRWLNPYFFAAQIQIPNEYLGFGQRGIVSCRNDC